MLASSTTSAKTYGVGPELDAEGRLIGVEKARTKETTIIAKKIIEATMSTGLFNRSAVRDSDTALLVVGLPTL